MKVLQIHNYYRYAGGEDSVLDQEKELLEKNGNIVIRYTRTTREYQGLELLIKILSNLFYSFGAYRDVFQILQKEKPDIVHVHNTFPLISTSVFDACIDQKTPVIKTLHNYRILYPNALMLNGDKVDERTIGSTSLVTIRDKVYHDSYLFTLIVALYIDYHRFRNTWNKKVDRFIALTEFSKNIFVRHGISPDKLCVKPNFISDYEGVQQDTCNYFDELLSGKIDIEESFFLFVGRLSPEKGIIPVIKSWSLNIKLVIVGDGPDATIIHGMSNENIILLGSLPIEKVKYLMKKSTALIFPSLWYEGLPMVLIEAMSVGLPVISSNIGNQAQVIIDDYNGIHIQYDKPSQYVIESSKLLMDSERRKRLSENAKRIYNSKYSPSINYEILMDIYTRVINERKVYINI